MNGNQSPDKFFIPLSYNFLIYSSLNGPVGICLVPFFFEPTFKRLNLGRLCESFSYGDWSSFLFAFLGRLTFKLGSFSGVFPKISKFLSLAGFLSDCL